MCRREQTRSIVRRTKTARADATTRRVTLAGVCMQCVAQSTPMMATGLVVLRRRSFVAFLRASFARPLALIHR